jgi:hypothetical protein
MEVSSKDVDRSFLPRARARRRLEGVAAMTAAIDCEKDRWATVAFCAVALIGEPVNVQDAFLRQLLRTHFWMFPMECHRLTILRLSRATPLKLLLRALVDDGGNGNKLMSQAPGRTSRKTTLPGKAGWRGRQPYS